MRSLAERMDTRVSAQAISKYEAGKMMPSSAVLVGLGEALGVPLDFLMSAQVGGVDGLQFRELRRLSGRDRASAEAVLIDAVERCLTIEEILGLPSGGDCFEGRRHECVATWKGIDAMADELRRAWDLGMGPLPSLCAVFEERGIWVVEAGLPERTHGLTCRAQRDGRPVADAILLSDTTGVERKRFTLARELASRILRSIGNPAIRLDAALNRFASAFLVPSRSLVEEAGKNRRRVTYCEIIRLKHAYGVSAATMLARLGHVGVLRPSAFRRARKTYARSWRMSEPEPIGGSEGFAALDKPRRFERLVWRAVGEELISPVRAAELLNESVTTVEWQIRGPSVDPGAQAGSDPPMDTYDVILSWIEEDEGFVAESPEPSG